MSLRKRRKFNIPILMTTGVLGGGAPTTFTDDFARADGALGNGWTGATWSISSGVAVNTPTLGSELLTNPGFETHTGTLDDGTADTFTGWSIIDGTGGKGEAVSDTHGGSAAVKLTNGGETRAALSQVLTSVVGAWYRGEIWAKSDGVATAQLRLTNAFSLGKSTLATSYSNLILTGKATTTVSGFAAYHLTNVTGDVFFDDASFKRLTLSTLLATQTTTFVPRRISAKITRVDGTQAGVVHYSDDNNFVLAYIESPLNLSPTVVLVKYVGGTVTEVATANITYSAGAVLELDYNPSAQTYTVQYNGSTVIAAQSVTDSVFQTAKKAGLFSTYAGNSLDDFVTSANPT